MFRIIIAMTYFCIGIAVVTVEEDNRPKFYGDNLVLAVVSWPAFPAVRIYRSWVEDQN